MKIFKTNFAGNQFCFVIWSFQWKSKTVSENVQICGQTIPTCLYLQPFPCNPMSLTCLWLKANSKATQCNVRIVPWIHCSSETRDLHQAFTPSSKNANENIKSYYDGNMTTNMISEASFDSQGANEKKYDGNTTRNMISESWYLSRLSSFTTCECKTPHFIFLQWNHYRTSQWEWKGCTP